MRPLRLQVAIRRRLRWPLPLSGGTCCRGCGQNLDPLGDRAAACAVSGRLKLRSRPLEKTWVRVIREAGARVRENVFLRDTALPNIDPTDGRRIEIVATGLPLAHGIPIAVDATLISPLHADGTPFPHAAYRGGASFRRAENSKARTYPELVNSSLLKLVTVACEVGGRLNSTGSNLLAEAAAAKARAEPAALRSAAARAWRTRWTTMISVCVQDATAATLVDDGASWLEAADGPVPLAVDVWLNARHEPAHATKDNTPADDDLATAASVLSSGGPPAASAVCAPSGGPPAASAGPATASLLDPAAAASAVPAAPRELLRSSPVLEA